MLEPGDKVLHKFNRELGPGEVLAVESGRVRIRFPRPGSVLEFAVKNHAFVPLQLPEGTDPENWHEAYHEDLVERLAHLEVDSLAAFRNRMEALRLSRIREAGGLGSFLGGRIEIFPHQLHVAERAVSTDPVRWLLADEVGLGKTVEACLILSRLMRMHRVESAVIVAPASLTVQWLGELYRKFHQIFVLLDKDRQKDVRKDFGEDANPFEIHPRSVVALEDLERMPQLARQAREAGLEMIVVDEAHRLERRPGHPGSPVYRAVAPLVSKIPHALLLSATPLEADAHGFFRLLELLHPKEYGDWDKFQTQLDEGVPLFPCTSSTTRTDIGGLPPRVPHPIPVPEWPALDNAVKGALARTARNELEERQRVDAVIRAMEDPTGPEDPRLAWILAHEKKWHEAGDKMLVFVNRKESLDFLKGEIERRTMGHVGVFHEELSPAARDLEVAQFALKDGPHIMISTEAGGEGRNFEFCKGLILFDLPWDPALVEQRIGRLDRINRRGPVNIHYFAPTEPFAAAIVGLYEGLGIFREPMGGLDRSLAHVEEAIRTAARLPQPVIDRDNVIEETQETRNRMRKGLYHTLHRNRFQPDLVTPIMARIPADLEARNAKVVLEACRQFGFESFEKPGVSTWYVEFGNEAVIEHLPGVKGGARWLGTFDREEAVAHETIDFFAAGHPLVEGILHELEDGHRGEVCLLEVPGAGEEGAGLVAVIKEGADFRPMCFDFEGTRRDDWGRFFLEDPPRWRRASLASWGLDQDPALRQEWAKRVRTILYPCQAEGKVVAAAAFRLTG